MSFRVLSSSHSTLPSTRFKMVSQRSKVARLIFWAPLKQQKTKASSGSPACARVGRSAATKRLRSLGW
uniref:Uncharacterized protein n=1 Tax=Phenylobacterium glaciei TaxID=2803784 RepID=A0A974P1A3_9CAUL|nr:hypothetical protein JKL49_14035 [Phenylobacterium glaciei]